MKINDKRRRKWKIQKIDKHITYIGHIDKQNQQFPLLGNVQRTKKRKKPNLDYYISRQSFYLDCVCTIAKHLMLFLCSQLYIFLHFTHLAFYTSFRIFCHVFRSFSYCCSLFFCSYLFCYICAFACLSHVSSICLCFYTFYWFLQHEYTRFSKS